MSIEQWIDDFEVMINSLNKTVSPTAVGYLKRTYHNLTQISYITNSNKHWYIWNDMWEGVISRINKALTSGFNKDMNTHILSYKIQSAKTLVEVIDDWKNSDNYDNMISSISELEILFSNIHNIYIDKTKNMATQIKFRVNTLIITDHLWLMVKTISLIMY